MNTETEMFSLIRDLFTNESVDLYEERMKACDLAHLSVATAAVAAIGVRLAPGGRWKESILGQIATTTTCATRYAAIEWSLDALEVRQ